MPKPVKIAAVALTALWMLVCTAALCRAEVPFDAVCRINNQLGASANVGSGTLIDVSADRKCGLVLTCAHLFTEGTGAVTITFRDGQRHQATLVAIDHDADLAALDIGNPRQQPAELAIEPQGELVACGYGGEGLLQGVAGAALGYSEGVNQTSVRIAGAVRSGDSGGPVFDVRGRQVAVVWGESGGVTYASTGGPLRRFLDRFRLHRASIQFTQYQYPGNCVPCQQQGSQPSQCYRLPNGSVVCPDQRVGSVTAPASRIVRPDATPSAVSPPPTSLAQGCDCPPKLAALEARISELEARQPVQGPPGERGPQGEQGPRGTDGAHGKDAVFDVEAVAAAMQRALPPIHVVQKDARTGAVIAEKSVPLGGELTLNFGPGQQPVDVSRQ